MAQFSLGAFPGTRMRRLRRTPWIRSLVREVQLSAQDLIWPVFLMEGTGTQEPVPSMPGVFRFSLDRFLPFAQEAFDLGIPAVALFPSVSPSLRTVQAEEAFNPDNLICRSVRALKAALPDLGVMCDVALDPYTSHGHDGFLEHGVIQNDATVEALIKQSLVQAEAGCDILGPSDMMDGRIGAIRQALEEAGYQDVLLLSYSAKYASGFYGPFRDAVGSTQALVGDKKTYQMDYANRKEALREASLDLKEGADMIMVKPGMPYLDILSDLKNQLQVPTFVYQVSGEYAMLQAAIAQGWLSDRVIEESLLAFKRAGADGILTYYALEMARQWARGR